jgi:putative intracellular protease/amidase
MTLVSANDIAADVDILILVTTGFGWNYFDARNYFEQWGATVKVVSHTLTYEVDGCFNQDPTTIVSDYLTSELNESLLSQFDCLYIPAGGHWSPLISSSTALGWVETAYNLGLIIGTTCIGNRVVSHANGIVNGTTVAYYSLTNLEMENAGATVVAARVVSDNRIVTGGTGSGFPDGYTGAPTYEVCAAIIQEILGVSPVEENTVTPEIGTNETTFMIELAFGNITESYPLINHTEISQVSAILYEVDGREAAVELELNESDDSYFASLSDLELGTYTIDVSLRYDNQMYWVYREVVTFDVLESLPTTSNTTTSLTDIPILLVSVTGLAVVGIVIVSFLVIKRR